MPGALIHCLKCKCKTASINPTVVTTQRGGSMIKASCGQCGGKKCQIVSQQTAAHHLSPTTALSHH